MKVIESTQNRLSCGSHALSVKHPVSVTNMHVHPHMHVCNIMHVFQCDAKPWGKSTHKGPVVGPKFGADKVSTCYIFTLCLYCSGSECTVFILSCQIYTKCYNISQVQLSNYFHTECLCWGKLSRPPAMCNVCTLHKVIMKRLGKEEKN